MTLQRAPGEVEFDKVNNEKTNIENADNENADNENADNESADIEKAGIESANIKGANIEKDSWEPKILAFLCNWCSYAGADLAGTSRIQYPHNIRIVRLPCSGRINPIYIIKALLEGADGVMVSGCHPGDCHYMTGNMYARRRFTLLKKLLITAGISPDRIHFTWVSASEGVRFGSVAEEVTEKVRKLGPNRIIADCQKETKVLNGDEHARCATDICGLHQGYKNQKNEIVNVAKKLLKDGTVSAVLAYAPSEIEGDAAPRFFRNVDELDYIKWGETCTSNLAKYLLGKKEKIAIVAKPCDARAIVMYLVEKQIDRNNVHIIGVECAGMIGKDGMPADWCEDCMVRIPPIYDVLVRNSDMQGLSNSFENEEEKDIGDPVGKLTYQLAEPGFRSEEDYRDLENSIERFQEEIKKCILCYACRQACYGCYCTTCFIDSNIPSWLPSDIDIGGKMLYHLGRAMHLAGRCVECGACERACPSGVKIRYLIKEITHMCNELYGYSAGMDLEEAPAMAIFNAGDKEIGFLGGVGDESCCHSQE